MTTTNDDGGPAFPCLSTHCQRLNESEYDPGMTLRQYAAITLRVPNSGTDWLDEMIREARRDDFAAKAMASIVSALHEGIRPNDVPVLAGDANFIADAMLAARSNKEAK
jgi:hypothetical protein